MTKVKICGVTDLSDALLSAELGADALGFNFYKRSPRYIDPISVGTITKRLPKDLLKVGVFVKEPLARITEIADIAGLDAIQMHGDESPQYVLEARKRTGLKIIKAFRVLDSISLENVLRYDVDAIILDAFSTDGYGGMGATFEWDCVKEVQTAFPNFYLAGGLGPENIADAIVRLSPYGVDACSRLESAKGKKDEAKLKDFFREIRSTE